MFRRLLPALVSVLAGLQTAWLAAQEIDFPQGGEGPPEALIIGMVVGVIVIALVFSLVVMGVIAFLLQMCLNRIPPEHRKMEPWKAFLLMIPCFNLVWNFMLYPGIAKSYQSYFQSIGRTDVGDCGEKLGLYYAVSVACCLVPILNYVAGVASLVLLIMFLVKAFELRGYIPVAATKPI